LKFRVERIAIIICLRNLIELVLCFFVEVVGNNFSVENIQIFLEFGDDEVAVFIIE
jgi:hypothetical protein